MSEAKIAQITLERVPLASVQPHPRNPRRHPKPGSPAWEILRRSLDHDYFDPMVVNRTNGMLVSGHLRREILLAGGYTHADASIVEYDEPTHLARLVAANTLLGEFEDSILSALAADLDAAGLDASLAGWDEKRIAALLDGPHLNDDTESANQLMTRAEELQEAWSVAPGDLFEVGSHRLLCGDCTSPASWRRLLDGRKADLVWTDPPYNVDYESAAGGMMNDSMSEGAYEAFLRAGMRQAFEHTKLGGAIYVAHADGLGRSVRNAFTAAGWKTAQCLVWVKTGFVLGRQDYHWQHEPILYGWRPGGAHYWQGGYAQSTVIDEEPAALKKRTKEELVSIIEALRNGRETTVVRGAKGTEGDLHPTIKPLPLVGRQIWNSTRRGELVIDLCMGSGTTMMAAEQTHRLAAGTELDPKFCAVILQRATQAGLPVRKVENVE